MQRGIIDSHNDQFSHSCREPGALVHQQGNLVPVGQLGKLRDTHTIVEPVFGQIKQGRGYRQFWLRGMRQVRGEWALICTTHNMLKLWRALRQRHHVRAQGYGR